MTPADPRTAAMEQKIRAVLTDELLQRSCDAGICYQPHDEASPLDDQSAARDLLAPVIVSALLALPVAETGWQDEKAKLEAEIVTLKAQLRAFHAAPSASVLRRLQAQIPASPEPPEGEKG